MSSVALKTLWSMFWGVKASFPLVGARWLRQRETSNVAKGGTPF